MACNSKALSGISGHCDKAAGGIKAVYIAEADKVTDVSVDTSTGKVATITMASGEKFHKYTFRPQSSNFNAEYSVDDAIGSAYWTNNVEMIFVRADAQKRLEIEALTADDCMAIVQDMEDEYIFMGCDNVVTVTAGSQETGTALSDRNGYTITLTERSNVPARFVEPSIISGIVDN